MSTPAPKVSTASGHDGLKLFAFYAFIAVAYFAKWPKWIGYVLLSLAILYLLYMVLIVWWIDKAVQNIKLGDANTKELCAAARKAETCGVWVDPNCYAGFIDGDKCKRAGIPTSVYLVLFGLILFNILLISAFYYRHDGGKVSGVKRSKRSKRY